MTENTLYMHTLQKSFPEWALRLSFFFLFLYSGIDLIRHPTGWYWAVRPLPWFMQNIINTQIGIDRYLQMQGGLELVFAFVFVAWFLPRFMVKAVSIFVAIEMAIILLLVGIIGDSFRDIGLLGAALALFFLSHSERSEESQVRDPSLRSG